MALVSTKEMLLDAMRGGYAVEAELGKIAGIEGDLVSTESLKTDPKEIGMVAMDAVKKIVKRRIKVCGSSGRA